MTLPEIEQYLTSLPEVTSSENFGYRFFFYATERVLPFATLAEADSPYDSVSNLNREGVFRVNIGVSKATFASLFSGEKKDWDYTEINVVMPHPDYAARNFLCVLNPTGDVLTATLHFINEAHALAKERAGKKRPSGNGEKAG